MSALDGWREEIRGLIPRGFLRRDQGAGLFVSDYPRHGEEEAVSSALREAGYTVEVRDGLAYLDGILETYRALAKRLPDAPVKPTEDFFWLYSLASHLQKTGGEPTEENLPLLCLTMKLLDANELDSLQRLLPPAVAEAQRKHIPLPRAAGQMILRALNERKESIC